ncbi:hypothetical protein CEV33_1798 [Brucella grignonensis]|uniref:Uncharacterized protein n=1 Tax=Brucella grignonensis TaxID=94627 RepID=A0A256F675_9HYPH|nr:hypothetical protein CEV33_1798 [Brucella grignonensis]
MRGPENETSGYSHLHDLDCKRCFWMRKPFMQGLARVVHYPVSEM